MGNQKEGGASRPGEPGYRLVPGFVVRRILCGLLLSVSTPAFAAHLFILAGQSNMQRLDPASSFTPAVEAAFGKERVIVVHDAHGGQPISRWCKTAAPDKRKGHEKAGDLYDGLLAKIRTALSGRAITSATLVWMQGEADARRMSGAQYARHLRELIAQFEGDLGHPGLYAVIGRLSDHGLTQPKYTHWADIRTAQVALADAHPRYAWVDTDDLNGPQNLLHYGKREYVELGARFATKAIELIQSQETPRDR